MASGDELPAVVDVVALGTGLPECLLSAACSRAGMMVLHLDKNPHYGGSWASFSFNSFAEWCEQRPEVCSDAQQPLNTEEIEALVDLNTESLLTGFPSSPVYDDIECRWNLVSQLDQNRVPGESATSAVGVDNASMASGTSEDKDDDVPQGDVQNGDSEALISPIPIEPEPDRPVENRPASGDIPPDAEVRDRQMLNQIISDSRRFNIDLCPKVLFSRGSMVDLMIRCSINNYAEFSNIDKVLVLYGDQLRTVPCSRSDVFQCQDLTMVEKRLLMKFLTFCVNYENHLNEIVEYEIQPVSRFFDAHELTPALQHYLLYAVGNGNSSTTTKEFLLSAKKFLSSTGVYGSSPLLWTLYGSGELPQCFCRLSAVYGGIFCLRCNMDAWVISKESGRIVAVIVNGQRVNCGYVISDISNTPQSVRQSLRYRPPDTLSRAVLVTDQSLLNDGADHICLLTHEFDHSQRTIRLFEISRRGMVCPRNTYIVYLMARGSGNAQADLQPMCERFFTTERSSNEDRKPRILWSAFFNQRIIKVDPQHSQMPENLLITPTPDSDISYESVVAEVTAMFHEKWPGKEFLAPIPPIHEDDFEAENPYANPTSQLAASNNPGNEVPAEHQPRDAEQREQH